MNVSLHAQARSQQRGIPQLVIDWLRDYGTEIHDGHGATIHHFDKRARRRLASATGREPLRRMSEWLNAYAVIATDGQLISVGHRYKRINRA